MAGTFDGGDIVTETGLLAVRQLDRKQGVLAEAAVRLPDPRSELLRHFSTEDLLTQTVYQPLGGYFDCNDAQTLRHDPLMQVLLDHAPGSDTATLASGSTLARFRDADTRRQRNIPVDERTIDQECQAAKCARLRQINRFLAELFVKTRPTPPSKPSPNAWAGCGTTASREDCRSHLAGRSPSPNDRVSPPFRDGCSPWRRPKVRAKPQQNTANPPASASPPMRPRPPVPETIDKPSTHV